MNREGWYLIGIIVLLVVIVGGGITANTVTVDSVVPDTCTEVVPQVKEEKVCESVPYQCTKACSQEKTVIEETELVYSIGQSYSSNRCIFATCNTVNVGITNQDDVGGYFEVTFTVKKYNGDVTNENVRKYVKPHETQTFTAGPYAFTIASWNYIVIPSKKEKAVTKVIYTNCPDVCYREECRNEQKVSYVNVQKKCTKVVKKTLGQVISES